MAGEVPSVTPKRMERVLLAKGFVLKPGRGKGSHRVYAHPITGRRTMTPSTPATSPRAPCASLCQADLTIDDLY